MEKPNKCYVISSVFNKKKTISELKQFYLFFIFKDSNNIYENETNYLFPYLFLLMKLFEDSESRFSGECMYLINIGRLH